MGEKTSILIVDDDEGACRTLALIFGGAGYETETAGTGREALEKARGRFFDLALLDIRLPDMEGTELLAPLQEMHPDMVMVMATAHASLETAVQALNEGASAYINKPLKMEEVLVTVREALEKQRLMIENRRLYQQAQRELAERKRAEEALRALVLIDDLTNLYNRRGFVTLSQQQLKTANRAGRRMVLVFADFDGLKQINDTFGHPEGDRALVEAANVLRETFRQSDIIARIAGDEFVVLAIETNGAPAEVLAARFQENLEARNARGDLRYKLSLSMGLARYDPEYPCSIDELLAQADRAMYEKKRAK